MKRLIDVYVHDGEGYFPCLIGDKWQAAFLKFNPEESVDGLHRLDIHFKTDEAFVLLEGEAALIAAERTIGGGFCYQVVRMEPCRIYNIPRNVWHKVILSPTANVLIIENANAHLDDFDYFSIPQEKLTEVKATLRQYI